MKIKKTLAAIMAAVTIVSMGVLPQAYAAEKLDKKEVIAITVQEETQLIEFLQENGVDEATTTKLIDKFKKGKMWDSLKEEYQDMEPTSIIESEDGTITKRYVYPDGSVRVSTTQMPVAESVEEDAEFTIQGVSGGTSSSGSGYHSVTGAKVSEDLGILSGSFYADFTLVQGQYNDYISRVYDYEILFIGGYSTSESLQIVRSSESSSYKAEAKLNWTAVGYNGSFSNTCWVKLFVGADSAYSTHN